MSEMHILCGFDMPEFEKAITLQLKTKGYDAVIHTQISKKGVKDYLLQNPKCETVILQEIINNKKGYTAEEVASLTDKREVNVIIVLGARHIGSEYVKTLYSAGITNAIFQKGRKDGASAKDIVELILNKRSRAEARKYYGIDSQKIELGFIDDETYVGFYRRLHKDEENLLKNYLEVCSDLSPKQIGDFTRRLPVSEKEYLAQFEEFHMLMDALKKLGIDLRIKRPKKTNIGLKVTQQICVQGDSILFGTTEGSENNMDSQTSDRTEQVAQEVVADYFKENACDDEEEIFAGMSIAELLKAAEKDRTSEENDAEKAAFGPEEPTTNHQDGELKEVLEAQMRMEREALDAAVKAAMEDVERKEKQLEHSSIEQEKRLAEEREKLSEERQILENERIAQEKEYMRQKRQFEKEKATVFKEIEKERKEQLRRQKEEIARRHKEEMERIRQREREEAIHGRDDDDLELTYGGNQFSGSFMVVLVILCAMAAGVLFAIPYMSQTGLL